MHILKMLILNLTAIRKLQTKLIIRIQITKSKENNNIQAKLVHYISFHILLLCYDQYLTPTN